MSAAFCSIRGARFRALFSLLGRGHTFMPASLATVSCVPREVSSTTSQTSTSVSIIVEWENMVLAEQARARSMLRELHQQASELIGKAAKGAFYTKVEAPLELLVMFDPEDGEEGVRKAV